MIDNLTIGLPQTSQDFGYRTQRGLTVAKTNHAGTPARMRIGLASRLS
jgi:hypothetical protein